VPNAVVKVADAEFLIDPDPDHDNLTTSQEHALGTGPLRADSDADGVSDWEELHLFRTEPLLADSDGDGLSDGEEALLLFTSPLRTDSDGDGAGDFAELVAGTNPANPGSVLAITGIVRNADGSVTLRWSGVVGRTYRVRRSGSPDFSAAEKISSGGGVRKE